MSNIMAAIGIAQLSRFSSLSKKRKFRILRGKFKTYNYRSFKPKRLVINAKKRIELKKRRIKLIYKQQTNRKQIIKKLILVRSITNTIRKIKKNL